MGEQRIYACARPRHRSVDPFASQQQSTADPAGFTKKLQWRPHCGGVVKAGEMVKCGDRYHGQRSSVAGGPAQGPGIDAGRAADYPRNTKKEPP